jgi:hypothetical protein
MCAEHRVRDTFDRLASEYDELKLRVIPRYRQVQVSHSATPTGLRGNVFSNSDAARRNGQRLSSGIIQSRIMSLSSSRQRCVT